MANICAVLRGQISTSSSRPFFIIRISYIMKSEIKKVYFVPYKYIWNIWVQKNDTGGKKSIWNIWITIHEYSALVLMQKLLQIY